MKALCLLGASVHALGELTASSLRTLVELEGALKRSLPPPPRHRGTMWSIVFAFAPQYWQRALSRAKICCFDGRQLAMGLRVYDIFWYCLSTITDGRGRSRNSETKRRPDCSSICAFSFIISKSPRRSLVNEIAV